ncbi:replication initiation protein [Burkholderiaceae bacterium DAT-1]|nr:replication initiation protein [Burkholderiaceae bacterium DAT-1]
MSTSEMVVKQLAFELFQEADRSATPITDIERDIGLNRSNATIHVGGNKLSLLGRRLVNALFFIAHRDAMETEIHSAPLDYFKWLANYDSNNHKYLKDCLREVQKTLIDIQIDNADLDTNHEKWASIPYINEVYFTNGKIHFSIPKKLRPTLQQPTSFTYLSLRMTNAFSSEYAHNLYERCAAVKYIGHTPWWSVEEFRRLTNTLDLASYDEFKELRRKVITPAITQINEFSDIKIALETRSVTGSKRIGALRFVIEDNKEGKYVLAKPLDEMLFNVLKEEFGLSNTEIAAISGQFDNEYIQSKVDFMRQRMLKKKIEYPGKYFRKVLDEDMNLVRQSLPEQPASSTTKTRKPRKAVIVEEDTLSVVDASSSEVRTFWEAQSRKSQSELLEAFRASPFFSSFRRRFAGKEIDVDSNPMMRAQLDAFLMTRLETKA